MLATIIKTDKKTQPTEGSYALLLYIHNLI